MPTFTDLTGIQAQILRDLGLDHHPPGARKIAWRKKRREGKKRKRNSKEALFPCPWQYDLPICRKQKEIMKALETPEEKRLRRLAKKDAKERKKREKEGWDKVSVETETGRTGYVYR